MHIRSVIYGKKESEYYWKATEWWLNGTEWSLKCTCHSVDWMVTERWLNGAFQFSRNGGVSSCDFLHTKIWGMHLLNNHMNTFTMLHLCKSDFRIQWCLSFVWIISKTLLPKDKYLGGFTILLFKPLLKTGNDEASLIYKLRAFMFVVEIVINSTKNKLLRKWY